MRTDQDQPADVAGELVTLDQRPEALARLDDRATRRAAEIVTEATPANTIRARKGALKYFRTWADVNGLDDAFPVDPAVLLSFVVDHLDGLARPIDSEMVRRGVKRSVGRLSFATISARVSHVSKAHRLAGMPSPADDVRVKETMAAARRKQAKTGGTRKLDAVTLRPLERLLSTCDTDIEGGREAAGLRDRALLLVAWSSGGRRRSEVAAIRCEDLRPDGEEYVLKLPYSKTDQAGRGHVVPITGRAAKALRAWLAHAGIGAGPIFRRVTRWGVLGDKALSGEAVRLIVKARAERAGLNEAEIAPHSLRAGYLTEAGRLGIPLGEAMALSGHRTAAVALGYHRIGDVLRSEAGRLAG